MQILFFLLLLSCTALSRSTFNFDAQGSRNSNLNSMYTGQLSMDHSPTGTWTISAWARDNQGQIFIYEEGRALSISQGKAQCVPSSHLPPLHQLQNSFERHVLVDRDTIQPNIAQQCPADFSFIRIQFVGEDFLVCISSDFNTLHSAYGSQFTVKFTDADIFNINDFKDQYILQPCPLTTYKTPKHFPAHVSPWWKRSSGVKRQVQEKACIFIHGSGIREDGNWTSEFREYWGNLHEFELTPQCKTRKFIHINTFNHGWDYKPNQQKVCDLVVSESNSKTVANDTIVFTHSMGGLIFAAAQINGFCELGKGSKWFAASPPTNGSQVANWVDQICANEEWRNVISIASNVCDGTQPAASYYTLSSDYPGLDKLHKFMQKAANGQMCGTSPYGLHSIDSAGLVLLASISGLSDPNDGLVSWDSCHLAYVYDPTFESVWYQTPTNHADTTCRNGDGWWGLDRRPCSWYSTKY